uniref:PLD phosphodiesterase domain-containing protein n=1 Tax=Setaria digitata TaxID=48799 RepID=A0A915PSX2_9BILA
METRKNQTAHDNSFSNNNLRRTVKLLFVLLLPVIVFVSLPYKELNKTISGNILDETQCSKTCRIRFVQSTPENVSFTTLNSSYSTYTVWNSLISNSKKELILAAYKTSLRGEHVLNYDYSQLYSNQVNVLNVISSIILCQGSKIHDAVLQAGLKRKVLIRMIENYPPKDKGDNEDGISFAKLGIINRRTLNLENSLGGGKMHTKFIISDSEHFYLGSANLDWRSLNQKLELGVIVENCSCLAKDLLNIFEKYWEVAGSKYKSGDVEHLPKYPESDQSTVVYNRQRPLTVSSAHVEVYMAASPRSLNGSGREWDLLAILNAIENARKFLYIEVMDYFPMFVYHSPRRYWPTIDNSLRRAILRGVQVKILTAAIHFPEYSLRFLSSLEVLNKINYSSIEVKIFKVPTDVDMQHIMVRERRMHTKFLVTDTVAIIGTSNWSGDYFDGGTTGVAFILNQTKVPLEKRCFVEDLRHIFISHWSSDYTHDVRDYERDCLQTKTGSYCEAEKDLSLLEL